MHSPLREVELARLPTDRPRAAAAVCAWLGAALGACPVVVRAARGAGNATGCGAGASSRERHDLAQWARFLPARGCAAPAATGDGAARAAHGAAVERAVALVLINERYAESLELLEAAFELKGGALKLRHSNAREQHAAVDAARAGTAASAEFAALVASTCLHDAYDAATRKFDADLRAARAGELRFEVRQTPAGSNRTARAPPPASGRPGCWSVSREVSPVES